jgi:signal peptidase I
MFNLDSPWKVVALVASIALLRVVYTVWKTSPFRAAILELLDSGLIAFALVFFIIRPFVVQAFFIPSASMEPTLLGHDRGRPVPHEPGQFYARTVHDRILVNKFIYRLRTPERGDIVVFRAPPEALVIQDNHTDFIKRIVALPGESVEVRRYEGVFINGGKLAESYIQDNHQVDYDYGPVTLAPGQYFVMGDNRRDSNDSHRWGPLEQSRILGKAMFIFWPPGRISLVH